MPLTTHTMCAAWPRLTTNNSDEPPKASCNGRGRQCHSFWDLSVSAPMMKRQLTMAVLCHNLDCDPGSCYFVIVCHHDHIDLLALGFKLGVSMPNLITILRCRVPSDRALIVFGLQCCCNGDSAGVGRWHAMRRPMRTQSTAFRPIPRRVPQFDQAQYCYIVLWCVQG